MKKGNVVLWSCYIGIAIIAHLISFSSNIGYNFPLFTSITYWVLWYIYTLIFIGIDCLCKIIKDEKTWGVPQFLFSIVSALALIFAACNIRDFHYETLRGIANIKESTNMSEIPTLDKLKDISLMDTASATKLGNRQLGKMQDLVSQFEVSKTYYTISYKNKIYKVAPLEYGSYFKNRCNDSIPGYVIVDPETNEAKYVEIEGGMNLSPSGYFEDNLFRYVQMKYPNQKLLNESCYLSTGAKVTSYSFQLDEDGTPYWVIPTVHYTAGVSYTQIDGAILLNALTNEVKKYDVDDIPAWVDLVYAGPVITTLYDFHGKYINGWFNLEQKGMTRTTTDYGYLRIDDDIYIYTGVTSVASDGSNIGFSIANTRTGDITYYAMDGAEEYSAMTAAEGAVQNYGYEASFPSLVMVDDEPTYTMVLKDNAGLIKMYAMVNMQNYTIVSVGNTLNEANEKYHKLLASGTDNIEVGSSLVEEIDTGNEDIGMPDKHVVSNEVISDRVITDQRYTAIDGNVYLTIEFDGKDKETFLIQ